MVTNLLEFLLVLTTEKGLGLDYDYKLYYTNQDIVLHYAKNKTEEINE